jgi:hypothetical protein
VPNNNSNNKKIITSSLTVTTTESLVVAERKKHEEDYSHKGENCHSKNTEDGKLDNEKLKAESKEKIKEEFEKSDREQKILLKEYRQNIIDFIIDNKDSIRIEDLKIYEPVYKCYRKKGNCHICTNLSNIICINCCNHNFKNKENWLCTNHWKQHSIEYHDQQ